MSYSYDFNMIQCDAERALASLIQADRLVCMNMLEVQSHKDFKANSYEMIKTCHMTTIALSKNLEGYSKCLESNYDEQSFREEVRKFINLHSKSVDRTKLVLDLYGRYRSRISSTYAGIVRGYITDIQEQQSEGDKFVIECQDLLNSYEDEL